MIFQRGLNHKCPPFEFDPNCLPIGSPLFQTWHFVHGSCSGYNRTSNVLRLAAISEKKYKIIETSDVLIEREGKTNFQRKRNNTIKLLGVI